MSVSYKAKCNKCGNIRTMTAETIEEAEKTKIRHDSPLPYECKGTLRFYKLITESKPGSANTPATTNTKTEPEPVTSSSNLYNELKLGNIKKSTCKGCRLSPDTCAKSPEMLAICQVEAFEYRFRTGKYNTTGTGVVEFSKDIKGVIIDGTPVYIEDIKRLFVARTDTFSLYKAEDAGKEVVHTPETNQPPTDNDILRSLMGDITIGFRPVNPETNLCKWICYDIDKHSCEGTIYASNPRLAVDEIVNHHKEWYNLTGYIELSGSPDSYHVWIFIEPVDNEIVLKFDKEFMEKCDPSINRCICKRVEKGQGHMIKLPYTINIKNGVRSKFIDGIDISKIQPEKFPNLK